MVFGSKFPSASALTALADDRTVKAAADKDPIAKTDVDLGIVNIEIGMAPVRPAEFVILHIGQKTSDAKAGTALDAAFQIAALDGEDLSSADNGASGGTAPMPAFASYEAPFDEIYARVTQQQGRVALDADFNGASVDMADVDGGISPTFQTFALFPHSSAVSGDSTYLPTVEFAGRIAKALDDGIDWPVFGSGDDSVTEAQTGVIAKKVGMTSQFFSAGLSPVYGPEWTDVLAADPGITYAAIGRPKVLILDEPAADAADDARPGFGASHEEFVFAPNTESAGLIGFGDGVAGRIPTGTNNASTEYRFGSGDENPGRAGMADGDTSTFNFHASDMPLPGMSPGDVDLIGFFLQEAGAEDDGVTPDGTGGDPVAFWALADHNGALIVPDDHPWLLG
ncbi:MAG: hypothetical protein AAF914_07990 [Pseudomonadota bacterium]